MYQVHYTTLICQVTVVCMEWWCGVGTYLYFDCFLRNTATATTTAATMVTTTSRRITHVTTAMTVTSVGGSVGVSVGGVGGVGEVGGATMQLSGFEEEITTGHVVSTCS